MKQEGQFFDWNMILDEKFALGLRNWNAESLQFGSFVVVKLAKYRIIAHLQPENTYLPGILQLVVQTAETSSL